MNNYFEGWYLKHQKGGNTLAFIPGAANNGAFVQVITNKGSYNISYPLNRYKSGESIRVGNNIFSKKGVKIDVRPEGVNIYGEIRYAGITPIKYDIMGVFKYFPMECRHGIISMYHKLDGCINIEGEAVDFSGGVGYIEKDSGKSFPKSYFWIQCNDFAEKCSIIASVAHIPFLGLYFKGCICVIHYKGKEYRLATYLGAKSRRYGDEKVILKQGPLCLKISIAKNKGHSLYAPKKGNMSRIIREIPSGGARFEFFVRGRRVFDFESPNASYEFA